jgi:hypothetical protein
VGRVTHAVDRVPRPTAASESLAALELREPLRRLGATVERLAEDESVAGGSAEVAPLIKQLESRLAGLEWLVTSLGSRADWSASDHIPVRRVHEDSAR